MEKFGMNFGGGSSKKDLLETIETQKKQLLQYQTRLKDVVRAYKSLLKEKEALEASLKALSVSHETGVGLSGAHLADIASSSISFADFADDRSSVQSEDSMGTATSVDAAASLTSAKGELGSEDERTAVGASLLKSEEVSGSESSISTGSGDVPVAANEADKRVLQLKTQLATLTSSLATVTQEKSRMEASYLADKKKMKQDLDEANKKAEEDRSKLEAEMKCVQEQLAETKARLITQQHDRAQEQSDHAVMLRELQKLLQGERTLRQDVELKLEETREALAGRVYVADRVEESELQTKQLSRVVEELKRELQAVQEENSKPDPRLQELQDEIGSLKSHFQAQLLQEMKKIFVLTCVYLVALSLSLVGSSSVLAVSTLRRRCFHSQLLPLFLLSLADFLAALVLIITAAIQLLPAQLFVLAYEFCPYGLMLAMVSTDEMFYAISFLMVIVYAYEVNRTIRGWRVTHMTALQERRRCAERVQHCLPYTLAWLLPALMFLGQLLRRDVAPTAVEPSVPRTANRSRGAYSLYCSSCLVLIHRAQDVCYTYTGGKDTGLEMKIIFFLYLLLVLTCCTFLYCRVKLWCRRNNEGRLLNMENGGFARRNIQSVCKISRSFQLVFLICWTPGEWLLLEQEWCLALSSFSTMIPSHCNQVPTHGFPHRPPGQHSVPAFSPLPCGIPASGQMCVRGQAEQQESGWL
ncbi:GRIP and coiled-coil domain-containing protein 1 isoform X3 [Dermochelys coriacea]|uniref:GRIP and coiled-coil domain-containing protein 1 isoform X3 n=1 Tax=Dermochelys coriacea TaxID=27794 RepID=UPI001CA88D77|nr:GRIP and coiled-coil domain-containing protein 1 isoform X3 [Dermochelys coriacea]